MRLSPYIRRKTFSTAHFGFEQDILIRHTIAEIQFPFTIAIIMRTRAAHSLAANKITPPTPLSSSIIHKAIHARYAFSPRNFPRFYIIFFNLHPRVHGCVPEFSTWPCLARSGTKRELPNRGSRHPSGHVASVVTRRP